MMKKVLALVVVAFASGCGFTTSHQLSQSDITSVPKRQGTVIADGCTLDTFQMGTLQTSAAKLVIHDVVLDCLVPHADGSVGPSDASSQAQLDALVGQIKQLGYGVSLAASFVTDNGYVFDGAQTAKELADPAWVTKVVTNLAQVAHAADGVELDLEQLPTSARPNVTQLVASVAATLHPTKKLGVFLPPQTAVPSDVPGGDAFDVAALAPYADRFRVMTLDYSGNVAGPTIDSGWAVDALRFAQNEAPNAAMDVSFPLYGNDYLLSGSGGVRLTTYLEALGLADTFKTTPSRGATQELFLDYNDEASRPHELWYDDATSTLVTLAAWDTKTLPSTVGVVYYGFGAEDPELWAAIARASQ